MQERLVACLAPMMVRHTKADVCLPPPIHVPDCSWVQIADHVATGRGTMVQFH